MTCVSCLLRACLLVAGLSAALAQPAPAATVDIPYSQFTLPNGLRVIVHEDHKAPIVAVDLWYHVGSKDEKPGKTGFAHLYEHLMFESSENHKGKYFDPFEKVGATEQNGTTDTDRTNFFENVPTTALDMALWMESDRMGHLLGGVTQTTLDQQRGVVENEKRDDENQPYGRVDDTIANAMYPATHPYHHTTLGSMTDLDNASLDDVKTWFRTWYGPNNAVLVLAGDIDLATAKAKVARYFGDIPASPTIPLPKTWVAGHDTSTRGTMSDRVAQARIYRVWNVPEFGNPDLDRLQQLAQVLGGSRSSRLDTRLVNQDKLADRVSAYAEPAELGSNFYITADIKQGVDPAKVEAIIDEEVRRLLRDGPTLAETRREQTVFKAGFIRGIERIGGFGGKADELAQCAVLTGDPGCFRKRLQALDSATPEQLKAAADRWLSKGDYTLVVSPGPIPPTSRDQSTADEPYATQDRVVPPIDPKFTVTRSDVDRSKGVPEVTKFPDLKFPVLQRATLKNGMQIVLAERHEIPIVQMSMDFAGGYSADQGHKLGTASFTMSMLEEGAGEYDALAMGDAEESLGADIASSASLDADMVSLSALKDNLDPSLALYADMIRRPRLATAELDRVRQTWLAGIEQEKAEPRGVALRLLPPVMYGPDHPYGVPFSGNGTDASIRALRRDDLLAFQHQWLRPDNATIMIVGDITLGEIVPALEKYFGDWTAPSEPVPPLPIAEVALPSKPRILLVDRPGSSQANILIGQVIPSSIDIEHSLAFNLANDVLGGEFSSRLNTDLREDKHWAYGASSFEIGAKGQQPWIAQAAVQIDKTAASMTQMLRDIGTYASGEAQATDAEIAHAKNNAVRSLPGDYETGDGVLESISNIIRYHRPDDYIQTLKARVDDMPNSVIRQAASDLVPGSLTWIVVGDLAKIQAPVRALGLGEVSVIDSDGKPIAGKPVAEQAKK
jgi:zinc protease